MDYRLAQTVLVTSADVILFCLDVTKCLDELKKNTKQWLDLFLTTSPDGKFMLVMTKLDKECGEKTMIQK
jgi:hypothetical protein